MKWALALLLLGFTSLAVTQQKRQPVRGPRENETERFRYRNPSDPDTNHYCRFCPKRALEDSTYSYMQVTDCLGYYERNEKWSETLTPYEWNNKKFPFCNEGDTPGCGPPPQAPVFQNIIWDCERGYSDEVYSVYFPCKGRCNFTNEVHYHAYCNASLQWEITLDTNEFCRDESAAPTKDEVESDGIGWRVLVGIVVGVLFLLCVVCSVVVCLVYRRKRKTKKKKRQEENGDIELQVVPTRIVRNGVNGLAGQHPGHGLPPGGPGAQSRLNAAVRTGSGNTGARPKVHQNGRPGKIVNQNANLVARVHSPPDSMVDRISISGASQATGMGQSQTMCKELYVSKVDHESSYTNPNTSVKRAAATNSVATQAVLGEHRQQVVGSEGPHSIPFMSPCAKNTLQTGSVDSPIYQGTVNQFSHNQSHGSGHLGSNSSVQSGQDRNHKSVSSQCSVATSTSESPSVFETQITSDPQQEKASKLHSSSKSSEGVNVNYLSHHSDILGESDDDNNAEVNEKSALLSTENNSHTNQQLMTCDETTRLLSEDGNHSIDSIRNLPGSSLKEPVEHEEGQGLGDDEDVRIIEEKVKPVVIVTAKGHKQESNNKFEVTKGEPFTVVAKTVLGRKGKFTIERNGPAIKGKVIEGLHQVVHVEKACTEDSGHISWSLLSDEGEFSGTFELVVVDKGEEARPLQPIGASARECRVEETRGEASVKNQDPMIPNNTPSQSRPFAGMPTLTGSSFENDPQSVFQQRDPYHRAEDSIIEEPLESATEFYRTVLENSVEGEVCKGETEYNDPGFQTLNLNTFSSALSTRGIPSGSSAISVSNNAIRGSNGGQPGRICDSDQTDRKRPVDVDGPHNCCLRLKDLSEKLKNKLAEGCKFEILKDLAKQHGVDESLLMAFQCLVEQDGSQVVLSLFGLLMEEGLRIGHVVQYVCESASNENSVLEILQSDHSDCPFCRKYFS